MINKFFSICLAALLAGCTVGPNFQRPATPAADHYAMSGDDPIAGPVQARVGETVIADWWTLFQSPDLDAVVREAIADNKTLKQARARLAAARDAQRAEGSLVQLDLNAGVQPERLNLAAAGLNVAKLPPGLNFPNNPQFNLYSIGLTAEYNSDLFGGVRRRRESLAAAASAQAHELEAAYLTLTGQVVLACLNIAATNADLAAREEVIDSDRANLDMLNKAFAAGGANGNGVKAAESLLAQDEVGIPVDRQALAVARHRVAALVGKTSAEWSPPDFAPINGGPVAVLPAILPVSLPSEMVHNRPDILEAEAQLHAATAEIGVETANLYPNITLSGSLAQETLQPANLFAYSGTAWTVVGGLTAPIFHGGELKAKKREAEDNARAALAAYQETVIEAFAQVANALEAINHDNNAYAALMRALDAAKIQLDMERNGFRAGGSSGQSVVLAERDWRRLRIQLAQLTAGRYSDAANLLLTTARVPPGLTEQNVAAGR